MRAFERRLEHLVEGTFARIFKSGLTPLEIGRRIIREIDAHPSVGVDGTVAVPNHFWVYISSDDHSRFSEVSTTLTAELAEAAREHIRDERYRVLGPVSVTLVEADEYPEGAFQVQAQWREADAGAVPASVVLESGERLDLGQGEFTVGRMIGSSLEVTDANVSRNHAVLRPVLNGWVVVDLGSTNGTTVNGVPVSESHLRSGDRVVFGSTAVTFELG